MAKRKTKKDLPAPEIEDTSEIIDPTPEMIKVEVVITALRIGGKDWHKKEKTYEEGGIFSAPKEWAESTNSVKPVTAIVAG